ncbi:hypothetical protein KKE92_03750 [Candidatus Micrarchaeota archaeon]|nr:hypothetical protein [Candidatus Micrarchaeota archaeon]MBU1681334.1 hypothetical protein [Candidatus Micrarchaeota archaeon]
MMKKLELEIAALKERNIRVESDKAWETSLFRRIIIAGGTYFLSLTLFLIIEAPNPYLASFVPTLAFVLSTLTLPFFKKRWTSSR